MSTTFGSADVPFVDMAANQSLLSQRVAEALVPVFTRYGLALDAFAVESVSLPAELQKALDLRIGAGMAGDRARHAIPDRAGDSARRAEAGGIAGIGAGLAAGAAIGQAMAGQMAGAAQPAPAAPPAPAAAPVAAAPTAAPAEGTDYVQRLEQLKALFDKGLVTEDEYSRAKAEILAKLTR